MKKTVLIPALLFVASLPWQANAGTVSYSFAGPGVSATVNLTYGSATDGKYAQAFEVTGISGTFSDSNNGLGIVNATIGPLVAINHATPEVTNTLAPAAMAICIANRATPPPTPVINTRSPGQRRALVIRAL